MSGPRVVHNKVLGGWFVVRGPHQTPIGGRHATREAALASMGHPAGIPRGQAKTSPPGEPEAARHANQSASSARSSHSGSPYRLPGKLA